MSGNSFDIEEKPILIVEDNAVDVALIRRAVLVKTTKLDSVLLDTPSR